MNSPFKYGPIVKDKEFTNREDEIKRLLENFVSGINTILISPRKWGKSSLVEKTAALLNEKSDNHRFVFVDLMRVIDENDFYSTYAKEIIKVTSSKAEEILQNIKQFLSKISPKITFGNDPLNDLEINFDIRKNEPTIDEILELPERIAKSKKCRIIICLDEFQEIENFSNSTQFQKKLRSVIQHHSHVSYCFYGSKKDLMTNLFNKKSMPFFKFGDIIFLPKIEKNKLADFIIERFNASGKTVSKTFADLITSTMKCHPYYVQQLSHLVWLNTSREVTEENFSVAIEDLLNQNSLFFEREVESLTASQIRFLKAICDGVTEGFSRAEFIFNYQLNSSANVLRVRRSLLNKQILDYENSKLVFSDPAFEYWFKTKYM